MQLLIGVIIEIHSVLEFELIWEILSLKQVRIYQLVYVWGSLCCMHGSGQGNLYLSNKNSFCKLGVWTSKYLVIQAWRCQCGVLNIAKAVVNPEMGEGIKSGFLKLYGQPVWPNQSLWLSKTKNKVARNQGWCSMLICALQVHMNIYRKHNILCKQLWGYPCTIRS